jgi:MoaA/NifB/PqqE/SkfB family radical SAM enzyme
MQKSKPIAWIQGQVMKLGFSFNPIRSLIQSGIEKHIYTLMVEENPFDLPRKVQVDKYEMLLAVLHSAQRGFSRGLIGPNAKKMMIDVLLSQGFIKSDNQHEKFQKAHGFSPPAFFAFCPTMNCNLNCKGCYAGSSKRTNVNLPYNIIQRMMRDKVDLWGSHYAVISGGEPLLYKDDGKTLFDIFADNRDHYFLFYTNGTLIDQDVAKRLSDLGNVTPAISIEGFEKETDERRGKGIYKKILAAFENLRNVGVPFGISTTAFRHNADLIVSDELVDFYFDKQGALYQWIFQYMPIGRGYLLDQMITPEQRMRMYERTWKYIREEKRFVADFWNCGTLSDGCIAAAGGNGGGYFYVDSNGTVSPCAFNPFTTHNVKDVYASGGNLDTIIFSPLFQKIRAWQRCYFHDRPKGQRGNLIAPCLIRDHYPEMRRIIDETGARPLDKYAAMSMEDASYLQGMTKYGEEIDRISRELWDKEYLGPEKDAATIAV